MDVDEVRERVAEIAKKAGDPEVAHIAEDTLWLAVLQNIAESDCEHAELAREAIKTDDLEFSRWYA